MICVVGIMEVVSIIICPLPPPHLTPVIDGVQTCVACPRAVHSAAIKDPLNNSYELEITSTEVVVVDTLNTYCYAAYRFIAS